MKQCLRSIGLPLLTLLVISLPAYRAQTQPTEGTGDGSGATQVPIGDTDATFEQAIALLHAGDMDASHTLIDDFFATHLSGDMLIVNYARAVLSNDGIDEAIAYLSSHIERFPTNHAASFELATFYMALLRFDEAVGLLNAVPPERPLLHEMARLNLGKVYRGLGRFAEATALYTELTEGNHSVFAEAALCEIEMSLGNLDACATRLEVAREVLGEHPALTQAQAILHYLSSEPEQALSAANSIFELGEPGSRTYMIVVMAHIALGQTDQAEAALLRARQPTIRGERHALTALIALANGDVEEAAAQYQLAMENNAIFADPSRAGQVLHWNSTLITSATGLLVSEEADSSGAAVNGNEHSAPTTSNDADGAGCCATVEQRPTDGFSVQWLALVLGLIATRRLHGRS